MSNRNINNAKKNKNDEFYTRMEDIENELQYYLHYFKNRIVYCNCDDPKHSNFWRYFYNNFHTLGLKHLTATYYQPRRQLWLKGDTYRFDYDGRNIEKKKINFFGEFQSYDCVQILNQSDIVCSNPPFSQFREYIDVLMNSKKDFLVIGNINAVTIDSIYHLYHNRRIWLGVNTRMKFDTPDNRDIPITSCWYTNMEHNKVNPFMKLTRTYNERDYPKYDNYDAIEVERTGNIPIDYTGMMGVPVSFIEKYNPNQFTLIGMDKTLLPKHTTNFRIGNEIKYRRLVIKHQPPAERTNI